MLNTKSYLCDAPLSGKETKTLLDANTSEAVATYASLTPQQIADGYAHARTVGNPTLRAYTIHQRALMLKELGLKLLERKEELYKLSAATGATRIDSWVDIEGGIGTMLSISSIARRELPDQTHLTEGNPDALSKSGNFIARHILTPKIGVAVHINAFNFPCWGMLEKFAPTFIAGVPSIIKPATNTSYLTYALVNIINELAILPKGSLNLLLGSTHGLLDLLDGQDTLTFTGSAKTASIIASNKNIINNNVKLNKEADSLNSIILGKSATPDTPAFTLAAKEIAREMTVKTGQKCTAIRRIMVPEEHQSALAEKIEQQLKKVVIASAHYSPEKGTNHVGPLVSLLQRAEVHESLDKLSSVCEVAYACPLDIVDGNKNTGGFVAPTVLLAKDQNADALHSIEVFGPVCTLIPYQDTSQAITLARRGEGSLVASIAAPDLDEQSELTHGIAPYHGRILLINQDFAKESTGHGSPLAPLVHGGPGRAGGGEELGGSRSIKHYMQRTAIQGTPTDITHLSGEYHRGATTTPATAHPFTKYFHQLNIGDSLTTHNRTITETDIINFGCLSGDHFYAHFDETASKDSIFGKRVAHGYLLVSIAAGLFVRPHLGPVLANYGMDNLRFVEPVAIGDTLHATLTVKQKIAKPKREADTKKTGVVIWQVELFNQENTLVALYDILTLVEDIE